VCVCVCVCVCARARAREETPSVDAAEPLARGSNVEDEHRIWIVLVQSL